MRVPGQMEGHSSIPCVLYTKKSYHHCFFSEFAYIFRHRLEFGDFCVCLCSLQLMNREEHVFFSEAVAFVSQFWYFFFAEAISSRALKKE